MVSNRTAACEQIARLKAEGRQREIEAELRKMPRISERKMALAYVEGRTLGDYPHDMDICQRFAVLNRDTMARVIISGLRIRARAKWQTIHNYIDISHWILRKGSISA